jgi:hypothetical protein
LGDVIVAAARKAGASERGGQPPRPTAIGPHGYLGWLSSAGLEWLWFCKASGCPELSSALVFSPRGSVDLASLAVGADAVGVPAESLGGKELAAP